MSKLKTTTPSDNDQQQNGSSSTNQKEAAVGGGVNLKEEEEASKKNVTIAHDTKRNNNRTTAAFSVASGRASTVVDDGTFTTTQSSWVPHRYTYQASSDNASMNSSMPSSALKNDKKKSQTQQQRQKTTSKEEQAAAGSNSSHQPSLTERVGNSALSSTIGILKLFGDVTLSTTGTILSPSLEITRTVLLPQLLAALADHISNISPQRLKDWFRILSASVHHLIAVIVSTDRGSVFRSKVVRAFGDVVDVASSDTSRQTIMDGMACFVKLGEALHTPEFKAYLDQLSIWGCRMVDTIGQDKNKKLIHDFWDLIWSGVELSNDPSTILALAEVAAYLCHALEMEDAAIHAIAKEREELHRKAAERRQERNQYQKATYTDSYLFTDTNATVEEVILSALGLIQKSVEEAKLNDNNASNEQQYHSGDTIPGSVVLSAQDEEEEDEESSTKASRTVHYSPPQTVASAKPSREDKTEGGEDSKAKKKEEEERRRRTVCEFDSHDIDTNILREKIEERSVAVEQERFQQEKTPSTAHIPSQKFTGSTKFVTTTTQRKNPDQKSSAGVAGTKDDGKMDIEEVASLAKSSERANNAPKQGNNLSLEDEDDQMATNQSGDTTEYVDDPVGIPLEHSLPLEGETPITHFYRVLDEVLTKRRDNAMDSLLTRSGLATEHLDQSAENHQRSLKERLRKLRDAVGADQHLTPPRDPVPLHHANLDNVERFLRKNKKAMFACVLISLYFAAIFFAFGCYGIYMFVFPSAPRPSYTTIDPAAVSSSSKSGSEMHLPLLIREDPRRQSKNNEYVIRVIREVVHVNEKGETIKVEEHDEL